jgi:hypothetical protein
MMRFWMLLNNGKFVSSYGMSDERDFLNIDDFTDQIFFQPCL